MSDNHITLDALLPPDIAIKAEDVGVKKGNMSALTMFLLAVLAGAFIGMGAIFCTTVITGNGADGAIKLPFGVVKLLGGLVFCLGLILVIVAGAELFTGNNLMPMAVASKKLPISRLLRNWVIVYAGNFVGSILTAYLMFWSKQYTMSGGLLGVTAMSIADGKCGLDFSTALVRGIYCNALVCLAVWLTFSGRSATDKILAIIFPISAFVAAGFEHSVANMYFIPIGLFIKAGAPLDYWETINKTATDFSNLDWNNFFISNLIPVTLGNIIGGAFFVGAIYWLVFRRKSG